MRKTRWGILSTATIGTKKVIPGIQRSRTAEVVAIAARDLARAKAAAAELGIPKAYGAYAEMLADPEIEAVYNPLRVVPAGVGQPRCEVVFTVRSRPGMSAEDFEADAAAVAADLQTLKRLLDG